MIAPTSFFADYGCHVRILEQARGLAARGHPLLLCTYHSGRDISGLTIRRTPRLPWRRGAEIGSSWHKLILDFFLLWVVWRAAQRFRPDVLHAYLHEGALIGAIVGRVLHIPLVFDFQGSLTSEMVDHHFLRPNSLLFGSLQRLERWIDRQPAIILANSQHSVTLLSHQFGICAERIRLVPDCVDTERFSPLVVPSEESKKRLKLQLGIPPEALVIVYLGLLAPYQGIDLLLRSMRILDREWNVHLLVMGFPNVERYRRMAGELGIADRVTFTGPVPYEDAHRMLALGDIAVGPKISATEGSGKLLNYMAMGLPVVAFDTPVSREYLGEEGLLVPIGDVEAFAAALARLARASDERVERGRRLRERAIVHFRWPVALESIEEAYAVVCRLS